MSLGGQIGDPFWKEDTKSSKSDKDVGRDNNFVIDHTYPFLDTILSRLDNRLSKTDKRLSVTDNKIKYIIPIPSSAMIGRNDIRDQLDFERFWLIGVFVEKVTWVEQEMY